MIERLKHYRELWGWSQAFVSAMLHVSRSTISRWERGASTPTTSNQDKVDALVLALEQATRPRSDAPPEVHVGGDAVGGDQHVGRDKVAGDVITTADGSTAYVIRESVIVVVTDPDMLQAILAKQRDE